jgi:RimJ/RimL family protein N-acetyltransferase
VRWDGVTILTTSRLTLRTYRREDLAPYAALNADPEVVRYLGGPLTREGSDAIAQWAQERWAEERLGLLAVERTEDQTFLGMCGVHHLESFPDDLEVAWRLARPYWGHGYATEAATAWLDHAFDTLGTARVISVADPPNDRSIAVMRRLGMRYQRKLEIEEEGDRFEVVLYAVDAERWHERRPSARPLR